MRHRGNRAGRGPLALALLLAVGASPAWAAMTERVSVGPGGVEANGRSIGAVISFDARYVAFLSDATNLVPGVGNGKLQVYLHDRQTGTNELISVGLGGHGGNGDSAFTLSLSADNHYVVFDSEASDLVTGDTNQARDTFVRDRVAHVTFRADLSSTGAQASGGSLEGQISSNGRYVAFSSTSPDLVGGDTPDTQDVFVRDLQAHTTERVSLDRTGQPFDQGSYAASISSNGRYVAFTAFAAKPIKHGVRLTPRIYLRDRGNRTTRKISVTPTGVQGNKYSDHAWITGDGRYVAFMSLASNLAPGDTNASEDVFVRDVRARTVRRVSVGPNGEQANGRSFLDVGRTITQDARYVVFVSDATNLVANDTNHVPDIFLKDLTTGAVIRVNISSTGEQADFGTIYDTFSLSGDGSAVAFDSLAHNLVPDDRNGESDVFVRTR